MLSEKLLQFIWQFQYFNTKKLFLTTGEPLQIISAGQLNHNQGPDFSGVKIKIGNTLWAGNAEIHVRASGWLAHHHDTDNQYNNVILHIVWEDDQPVFDSGGKIIPTLLLEPFVSSLMLSHYNELMLSQEFVACQNFLPVLSPIGWRSWQERLLVERLEKRSIAIFHQLKASHNHWEEVFWLRLARNFGVPVNGDAFECIAQTIPLAVLAKHKNSIQQLEALLLGQASLLPNSSDDHYVKLLLREHHFLRNKYNLTEVSIKPLFLRMRPANFPTVRLAQLAMLVHQSEHLFSKLLEATSEKEVCQLLAVTANDFWHYHYQFETNTPFKPKTLGKQMIENIMINTIVPMVFAYGQFHNQQLFKDKALDWLDALPAEQNSIIMQWNRKGVPIHSAFETQGLLELKKHYCDVRRCLACAAGNRILKDGK